jgi:DNA polymerase
MINNCKKCNLHKSRKNIVYGTGDINADILILGEAPGKTEDMLGIPFCGESGKLLDQMINEAAINVQYLPKIYFTNSIFCRPTDKIGGDNREPNKNELFNCHSNVISIIDIVSPKHIIFAGDVAEKNFKLDFPHYTKIMHPSAILRLGGRSSGFYLITVRILENVFRQCI